MSALVAFEREVILRGRRDDLLVKRSQLRLEVAMVESQLREIDQQLWENRCDEMKRVTDEVQTS